MDIIEFREYCLSKPGTAEDYPFDETTLCLRVGGKIFAITDTYDIPWRVNLKCNPERAIELRERYRNIHPGWHMNKHHWNTVYLGGDVDDRLFCELIDHSYDLILSSLSKKIRNQITQGLSK
jgi:predicted DNA-binding protein (MmcQ/YjbR family)